VIVRVDLIFKRLVETPDMRTVAGLAFAMLLAIPVGLYAIPSWSQAYMLDEMVVDYRQLIMKSQDAHAAAIGTILKGRFQTGSPWRRRPSIHMGRGWMGRFFSQA
jgi:hypothetical protein